MGKLEIILGVIIGLNIIVWSLNQNWPAVLGWGVAALEWTRLIYYQVDRERKHAQTGT